MAITAKKLPSGAWRARGYTVDEDGKRHFKSFTSASKKEAEALAAQYTSENKRTDTTNLTLKQAAEEYIENKRNVLSPSTIKGYRSVLENHAPELFAMQIGDIDALTVQRAVNKMAAGFAPKTVRNSHGFISAVLKSYRPELVLTTTLPKKKKADIYVPDEAEIKKIYELAKGTINEIPIFLAAECGLRASEIAALRAENVFPDHIEVKEATVKGDDNESHIKAPKSFTSYRSVPISEKVHDYLLEHSVDGKIVEQDNECVSHNFMKFRDRHNLNKALHLHALRHHYASKCLLMNIPQKYIAELMGHSSTDMIERVYQHIFPSAMQEFQEQLRVKMDEIL